MAEASWQKDPVGKFEFRWWDGTQWTDKVANGQNVSSDPLPADPARSNDNPAHVPTTSASAEKIQKMAAKGTQNTHGTGGGTLYTEPVLVVSQKAKLVEIKNEYAIYNQEGQQIGAVRQVGQSTFRKVLRFVSKIDSFLSHKLEIVDTQGNIVLKVERPAAFVKSKFQVSGPQGPIGEIAQKNMFGKIKFGFIVQGQEIGSLNAENWRAWNFNIQNGSGQEVAKIAKKFSGLMKAAFTTADSYVVEINGQLDPTLHAMVLASALTVDTALKQHKS